MDRGREHSEARHLFTAMIEVRWGDMDALGHVNNSRYFTYFEQVRVEWLRSLDSGWDRTAGPVLASARCDYKRPITYPATLEIRLLSDPPRRSSIQTYYEVRTQDGPETLYAFGEATVVWVDFESGRPVSLPEAFRAALPQ